MGEPAVFLWVLDTREMWPEARETKDLARVAHRAMSLLSSTEQAAVLRFYFVKDAKLSLGSALLKRLAISRFCGVSWSSATATRDARTKPVFIHPSPSTTSSSSASERDHQPLLFNITHQAGVVVLFGAHLPPAGAAIGVDIVCQGERRTRDIDSINREGWPHYISTHDEVFCPREVSRLRDLPLVDPDKRLSYFYTLWCIREAYVKMTGEALLAPWLRDLEIRYYSPAGETPPEGADKTLEVWFEGEIVRDVDVRLHKMLGGEYTICTVVRRGAGDITLEIPAFEVLDIDVVLSDAEELARKNG